MVWFLATDGTDGLFLIADGLLLIADGLFLIADGLLFGNGWFGLVLIYNYSDL